MAIPGLTPAMEAESTRASRRGIFAFGLLAFLGAAFSLAACFAQILITVVAALIGSAVLDVNPHGQALLMWVFALVGVIGLARDRKNYHSKIPLTIGVVP